ncbi:MAG TPA: ATP-binding protein, partial [Turneriella sp.]|nr:ATP-binding protein [Turneriella sp.]
IILYWAFRENSYLYYSVTNLAVVLYYIVFDGIATMVLFPESPRFVHSLLSILAMLYAGTYLMFVAQFSQLRAKHPLLDKLLWYFGYTLLFIGIFGHFTIGARMMNNLTIMISFSAVLVSFIAVLFVDSRNNAALKWFKSGNIFLLLFVLIFLFFLVGYLPSNVFTRNAYRIGTLIELIFFSLALAIRIRTIDDNRRTAEVRAEARMQFAADVSHELRTPLTAIVALTDLMGESQLDTKQTEYLRALKSAAGTMREFANDVLIYAKLEREKVSPERIAFSLHETLQKVADIYEQMARARGITFQRAWEIAPKKLWMGDPLRIGQVLQNLLSNALKFTSTGDKIVLGATVRTIGNKERIEISVRDTGKGISPEKLTDIFGAYVQADASTERHYGGTGLGLSIARQLSELMGGRLDVESTLGFGTVFTMILYLSPTAQQEKVVTVNYKQQVHQMQKPLRILHVEDQADIRLIFQYFFADTIHHLDSAESGEEGLELFKKHQHDIVFSDVRLPGIDGISVLREIQRIAMERFLPTKTVICSGSLLGNSESLPTPYILIKPISMHDVYATIIHLVNE